MLFGICLFFNLNITGKIIADITLESGTASNGNAWNKKGWVIETPGQYPKKVKFDFVGDKATAIKLEVGKSYKISFDLESREFNGKWYTDVRAFAFKEVKEEAE